MIAMHSASNNQATQAALSPVNLRETYLLLLQSSPPVAQRLQQEIKQQRQHQGPLAEDFLGVDLNIETIGQVIVELTKLGENALHTADHTGMERALLKQLLDCWLGLAEWMLFDIEVTDCSIH